MRLPLLTLGLLTLAHAAAGQTTARRLLTLDDMNRMRDVSHPQLSPDGAWVAFVVSRSDTVKDRHDRDIWMTSWDGATTVRVTSSKESETSPKWSPDGRYLSFLSGRENEDEDDGDQLWLLNRAGGEAERVTEIKSGISDYAWSPDGKRLVFVIDDGDSVEVGAGDSSKAKTPHPIVIDRFYFKEDVTGYLGRKRSHLYLFDLASRKLEPLTPGNFTELLPSWSPDGKSIAFTSKREGDPDRGDNWDVYVVDAHAGAVPRQLTTYDGADGSPDWASAPAWSPDGRTIAYIRGGAPKLIYYGQQDLALVPVSGGVPKILTADYDRNVTQPAWSADGKWIYFTVEDDRTQVLARMPADGGKIERVVDGRRVVENFSMSSGKIAVLNTTTDRPSEVFAVEGGTLRQLSHQNDSLLSTIKLAEVQEFMAGSKDGTQIGGLLIHPVDYQAGKKYPTILRIHGGPVSQHQDEFDFQFQLLAANGYAVVAMNPRGSSGRGEKFATAIYADWGNKDVQDVLAGVNYAVAQGIADPERLGIGGWSYGGILTNYTIASDTRFKAATSGAGTSDILAGYGTDMYVREYEAELGTPWKNSDVYLKLSYPFLHADRIVTPTLFLGGSKDFNVPLLNGEQMYQALRSLGRDTELVIYPNQYHGLTKPSYLRDRQARYLAWYGKYLR